MREISPAENLTADEFLKLKPPQAQQVAAEIRRQKKEQTRARPSLKLLDRSKLLSSNKRKRILDAVASFVDENLFGRSEMCMQFANLLQRALDYLGLPARFVLGTAMYYKDGEEIFRWEHAWVRIDGLVKTPSRPIVHFEL